MDPRPKYQKKRAREKHIKKVDDTHKELKEMLFFQKSLAFR